MSLLNTSVTPDRVLVSVDSRGTEIQDPRLTAYLGCALRDFAPDVAKLDVIAHLGAVFATRGDFLGGVNALAMLQMEIPQSLEDAVQVMPAILARAYENAMTQRNAAIGQTIAPQGLEVVLAGWSLTRMRAWFWERPADRDTFAAFEIKDSLFRPGAHWKMQPRRPDTAADMEAIARAEMEYARTDHPEMGHAIGGKLLLAEVTRFGFNLTTIADLTA